MLRLAIFITLLSLQSFSAAATKVVALHPLLADLAQKVGGEHVEVIDLVGQTGDPHHFEPTTADLKRTEGAALYIASGMGLESYLTRLRTILPRDVPVLEVGATLPAIEGACDHDDHDHDHHHHSHALDPHWWHSVDLFRRAVSIVAEALAKANPAAADDLNRNAAACRAELDELERWVKREVARIPRDKRHLATAHAAFNYFCKDFGFTAHPVQGINREQMPDPKQLAELIATLKKNRVGAIFPENESNPRILKTLTADTGIRLGKPLIADGGGGVTYAEMIRHNVGAIVEGLAE